MQAEIEGQKLRLSVVARSAQSSWKVGPGRNTAITPIGKRMTVTPIPDTIIQNLENDQFLMS